MLEVTIGAEPAGEAGEAVAMTVEEGETAEDKVAAGRTVAGRTVACGMPAERTAAAGGRVVVEGRAAEDSTPLAARRVASGERIRASRTIRHSTNAVPARTRIRLGWRESASSFGAHMPRCRYEDGPRWVGPSGERLVMVAADSAARRCVSVGA